MREDRGLAYSVGCASTGFTDAGVLHVYAGTSPEHLDEILGLFVAELRRAVNETVSDEELQLAKDQYVASILLGLESTSARAESLARQEIIHGRRLRPEEIIARIEAVTPADLRRIARARFTSDKLAFGALGDLNGFKVDRARLEI